MVVLGLQTAPGVLGDPLGGPFSGQTLLWNKHMQGPCSVIVE